MSAPTMPAGRKSAPPRTVNARDLAWLAEKADGIRDETHVLYCDQDGVHLELQDEFNEDLAILKVRTRSTNRERKPRPAQIPIGKNWDAVFLSEAAVEKFLFPYYKAQRLLTPADEQRLMERYYGEEKIIGIAHIAPSRPVLIFCDRDPEEFMVNTGNVRRLDAEELVPEPQGPK